MDNEDIVKKVWGEEQILVNGPLYCAKYLFVNPGFLCSTHRHGVKDETFICIAGSGFISINGEVRAFSEGDRQPVSPGTWHYFGSVDGMTLLEVSTTHSDSDVERRSESRRIGSGDTELWEIYHG
jgi:mannose-6-phosphate isomerase-like protein (cupin superfamily)